MNTEIPSYGLHQIGIQEVKRNWAWYLALGILLVLIGSVAMGRAFLTSVVSVMFFGWLMIIGGVLEGVHAFWKQRGWSGFFIDLFTGILYLVVGLMIVAHPAATAVALTLLISMFLIFGGMFRIAIALTVRYPNWIWVLVHGVINVLLGALIWSQWPVSGLWVIGLFVGIEMFFNGFSLIMLGLTAKSLPDLDPNMQNTTADE